MPLPKQANDSLSIEDIKSRLSISSVLSSYGLKPDRNGMLNCPFHEDKTPSLKVYPKTESFNCFGCGASGDQIEFIQLKEKSSKHEAIVKAKALMGEYPKAKTTAIKAKSESPKENYSKLYTEIFSYFRNGYTLRKDNKGRTYLQSRNLDVNKLEELGITLGYNSAQFHHRGRISPKEIKACEKAGLLIKSSNGGKSRNSYTPWASFCVIFPLKNPLGEITGMYGRNILANAKNNKHYYLKNSKGLFYTPKPETKQLIITESIIDFLSLYQIDEIRNRYDFMPIYGTNRLNAEHKAAIKELQHLEEIIFFLDGDKAGETAAIKYGKELKEAYPKVNVSQVETPKDEDINSLLEAHEPEILQHLIESRKEIVFTEKEPEHKESRDTIAETGEFSEDVPGSAKKSAGLPGAKRKEKETGLDASNKKRLTYTNGGFGFVIWGGVETENIHRLKINLLTVQTENPERYYQDDVNLYSNSQLQRYIKGTTEELECSSMGLKASLKNLKEDLETYRLNEIANQQKSLAPPVHRLTVKEQEQAMRFLKHKTLVKNTLESISKSGLVGEEQNGLLLFFLYLSRLSADPLHAIIYGKSGSGKTYLQTKISECLPEESVRTITSLTENTLYYSGKDFWKHKLLMIEDLEGVYNAFLPLREFMSKQSISKLTTDKDAKGNNVQKVLEVQGPICVSGATTKADIYEDNANRSFLLHVDESAGHAKKVMDYQRRKQAGIVNEMEQNKYKQLLKNSQRLLRKIEIRNPYAMMLELPESVFKKLRTNMHYLRLIEIITLYHQYQREVKTDANGNKYITTTPEDIEWANYLIKDSLLRKSDELSGQVRYFFESLKNFVDQKGESGTIYAKEVREAFRMNPMTLNRHLRELESRGYIQREGGNRKTGFEYRVKAWDEYEKLKSGIDVLDDILQKVREKAADFKSKYNTQKAAKS